MRFDAHGNEMRQVTVWLPVEVLQLIKADGLNLSRFLRQQLETVYGGDSTAVIVDRRLQLVEAARDAFDRQRQVQSEAEEKMERARSAARRLRAERDAAQARRAEIADALLQIVGDGPTDRYRRMLPENDLHGDQADDWDALIRRVSRLCGAEIDSAEVAAGLRTLVAAEA